MEFFWRIQLDLLHFSRYDVISNKIPPGAPAGGASSQARIEELFD